MQIVAALFIENFDLRPVPGPSTRLDLTGAYFSLPAPRPFPVTIEPHLVVIVRCPEDHPGTAALQTRFLRDDPAGGEPEEVARNVQPVQIEPGKFGYRLVRAELEFEEAETIEAHVRLDQDDHAVVVPLTVLPPVDGAGASADVDRIPDAGPGPA